jgi:hypothetical protein
VASGAPLINVVPLFETILEIVQLLLHIGQVLFPAHNKRPFEDAVFLLKRRNLRFNALVHPFNLS